jgi:hypothetical protein
MGAVASSAPILSFYGIVDPYAFYDRINDDFKVRTHGYMDSFGMHGFIFLVLIIVWLEREQELLRRASEVVGRALQCARHQGRPGTAETYVQHVQVSSQK